MIYYTVLVTLLLLFVYKAYEVVKQPSNSSSSSSSSSSSTTTTDFDFHTLHLQANVVTHSQYYETSPTTVLLGYHDHHDVLISDNNNSRRRSLSVVGDSPCKICSPLDLDLLEDKYLVKYDSTCANLELSTFFTNLSSDSKACFENQMVLQELCCDVSALPPRYECETEVHSRILSTSSSSSSNYQTTVPPIARGGKLDVKTWFDYWMVTDIDLASSTAEIYVFLYMEWLDPRLAWNITSDTCVNSIAVRASLDTENTDIWVPDFDLYNKVDGVQKMPEALATVYSDGSVYWRRDGGLKALCTFVGMRKFPFDSIGCQFIFGGRTHHTNVQYVPRSRTTFSTNNDNDDGYDDDGHTFPIGTLGDVGIFFPPYGQTYSEYEVLPYKTEFNDRNHKISFSLYFKRASKNYVLFIIVPVTIFTYLSFGQLLLDSKSSERISFGVNMVLILVAQSIVTSSMLPSCGEYMWINIFNVVSLFLTLGALIVTLVDNYLLQLDIDDGSTTLVEQPPRNKLSTAKVDELSEKDEELNLSADKNNNSSSNDDDDDDDDDDEGERKRKKMNLMNILARCHHSRSASSNTTNTKTTNTNRNNTIMTRMKLVPIIVFPLGYTIFLIAMFASRSNWEDDVDEIWKEL